MVKPAARIVIKFLELLGCVACVITKIITDHESRRVFVRNQKLSREWSLIHNITWSSGGNAFTNIVYGGYTIVIALMLITRCVDAKSRPTLFEKIVLSLGTLLFFAAGGLVFASIDQVHPDLHDNAIILGCLSFFVAILFVIDLADPLARMTAHMTQTETSALTAMDTPDRAMMKKDVSTDTEPTVFVVSKTDPNSHHHHNQHQPAHQQQQHHDLDHRDHHHDHHDYRDESPLNRSAESIVERKVYPSAQVPVFAHVRAPEESRRIAGKEIKYLPRQDYRDRRNYRDAGPASYATNRASTNQPNGSHQTRQQHSNVPGSYHDNDSFVEDIQPSRRSTYVPADKFDQEAMQMSSAPSSHHHRMRPPPPAKPLNIIRTNFGSNHSSPTESQHSAECRCSQRSTSTRRLEDSGRDEFDSPPIRPGFVANAAKKWDDRARSKSQPIVGLNTMV
uniref:MARVEL domain-containing protein n=1 Tax=Anopheles maculatus TaxID=74869 RepID=A0A182SCI6_9DIPT